MANHQAQMILVGLNQFLVLLQFVIHLMSDDQIILGSLVLPILLNRDQDKYRLAGLHTKLSREIFECFQYPTATTASSKRC